MIDTETARRVAEETARRYFALARAELGDRFATEHEAAQQAADPLAFSDVGVCRSLMQLAAKVEFNRAEIYRYSDVERSCDVRNLERENNSIPNVEALREAAYGHLVGRARAAKAQAFEVAATMLPIDWDLPRERRWIGGERREFCAYGSADLDGKSYRVLVSESPGGRLESGVWPLNGRHNSARGPEFMPHVHAAALRSYAAMRQAQRDAAREEVRTVEDYEREAAQLGDDSHISNAAEHRDVLETQRDAFDLDATREGLRQVREAAADPVYVLEGDRSLGWRYYVAPVTRDAPATWTAERSAASRFTLDEAQAEEAAAASAMGERLLRIRAFNRGKLDADAAELADLDAAAHVAELEARGAEIMARDGAEQPAFAPYAEHRARVAAGGYESPAEAAARPAAAGYGVAVRLIGEDGAGDLWEAGIATLQDAERKAASGYTGAGSEARVVVLETVAPWDQGVPIGEWHTFPAAPRVAPAARPRSVAPAQPEAIGAGSMAAALAAERFDSARDAIDAVSRFESVTLCDWSYTIEPDGGAWRVRVRAEG